ncbi:hypothetical protein D9M69_582700 [compost metagenome]
MGAALIPVVEHRAAVHPRPRHADRGHARALLDALGLRHLLAPAAIGQAAGFHAITMEEKENRLTGCDLRARKVANATVHLPRGLAGLAHGHRHPDRMPLGLALSPGQPKRSPHNVPVGRVEPFIESVQRVAACLSRHR